MDTYNFYLPIGDWSNDGHCKCEKYLIESNSHPTNKFLLWLISRLLLIIWFIWYSLLLHPKNNSNINIIKALTDEKLDEDNPKYIKGKIIE